MKQKATLGKFFSSNDFFVGKDVIISLLKSKLDEAQRFRQDKGEI